MTKKVECSKCGGSVEIPERVDAEVVKGIILCDRCASAKPKGKCAHDIGWFIKRQVSIFVFSDGRISIDNQHGKTAKLRATCNSTDCLQPRNLYIPQMISGQAKISKEKLKHRKGRA